MDCVYSRWTGQRWLYHSGITCVVVQCRNPEAIEKLKCFTDKDGVEYCAVRKPVDKEFNPIPNADYIQVRSRFCNEEWCPYYSRIDS